MAQFTYFEISGDIHDVDTVAVGSSGTAIISDDLAQGDEWLQSDPSDGTVQFTIDGLDFFGPAYSTSNGYEVEIYNVHVNGGGVVRIAYLTASNDPEGDGTSRIVVLKGSISTGDTLNKFKIIKGQSKQPLPYEDIPSAVICFTPGTGIATPRGEVAVEHLRVGDVVITADNGLQAIRWIGRKPMTGARFMAFPNLRPIRIRKDAFGPGQPARDMWVSPQHRMLVRSERATLNYGDPEVLAPAKGLLNDRSVTVDYGIRQTEYIHILFDRHELVFANGTPTESFHPGETGLSAVEETARAELFEIFPELAQRPADYGPSARRGLRVQEARGLRLM